MKKSDLTNIVISFERPITSELIGCEFLIKPPKIQGGGLPDQVVTTIETVSYEDIIEFLLESFEAISSASSISEAIYSMTSAIITLAWNATSIQLLPDEYKEILDFIKKTEEGYALNFKKIEELVQKDSNVIKVIEILVKKKLLLKEDGEYIVRKKLLTNIHLSFVQIADKELKIEKEINDEVNEIDITPKNDIVENEAIEEESKDINLNNKLDEVLLLFKDKILYDTTKEKQMDKLHAELQIYKQDVVFKATKPLINSVIYIYDDMDKMIQRYTDNPEELDLKKMLNILSTLKEDVEILLEENGVTQFSEEFKTRFDPKTQQLIKKVPIGDKEKVGEVVKKIRPGFENVTEIIRKERVAVYVYDETLNIEKENKIEGENDNE
jgi:molecular chaperone GrpE